MSVSQQTLNDRWKVEFLTYREAGRAPQLDIDMSFAQAIINDGRANQAQSPYVNISMPEAATLLRNANQNKGKLDIEVAYEYRPRTGVTYGFDNVCETGGTSQRQVGSFRINNKTSLKSEAIGGEASLCSPEGVSDQYMRALMNLVKEAVETLIRQIEYEVFAKDGANFRHIGNLPKLVAGPARPAGEQLPLFSVPNPGFQPAVNPLGFYNLKRDKRKGKQPTGTYAVASMAVTAFGDAFQTQSGYRPDGYSFVNGDSPIKSLIISDIISEPTADGGTGLEKALLIVPSGYLQFVSVNLNTPELNNVMNQGDHVRGTIVDPYLELRWDFFDNADKCARIIQRTLFLELHWGIISMPKCNSDDPALDGVNGIFLYDISCSNDTICDATNARDLSPAPAPANYAGCAPDDSEACGGGCTIDIRRVSQTATTLTITANFVVSQGARTFSQLNWAINGINAPAYDDQVTIEIPIADLVDGDLITVLLTDDLDCEATSPPIEFEA